MALSVILKKSISTSLVSKVLGFLSSLYVVNVAASVFDSGNFAAFLLLSSIGGWLNLLSSGVSPLISSTLLKTGVSKESYIVFNTSFIFTFISLLLSVLIFYLLFYFDFFAGIQELSDFNAVMVTVVLFAFTLLFSLGDSIRIGFHQTHIVNICFIIIGFLVLASFLYIDFNEIKRLDFLMLAFLLPGVLVKLTNLFLSLKKMQWLTLSHKFGVDFNIIELIFSTSLSFTLIQAAGLISVQLLLFLLSSYEQTELLNEFGVLFRFFALSGSFLTMLSVPLWPILLEKINKNEIELVTIVANKVMRVFIGYGFVILSILLIFGHIFFDVWTKGKVTFSTFEIVLIGLKFILICCSQAQMLILRAFEKYGIMGKILLIQAILEFLLAWILLNSGFYCLQFLIISQLIFSFCTICVMEKMTKKLFLESCP